MGALTQFACTACGKTLKSPKPIPEGTKIKCPKCTKVFVVGNGAPRRTAGDLGAAPPRRTAGDLSSAPPRRPTRTEKRKRSNPIVMWGTCFFVALIFSLIVWIPCRFAIIAAHGAAEKGINEGQDWQKEFDKQMKEKMKELENQKDQGRPKDKMD